jgi:hypothetical protein
MRAPDTPASVLLARSSTGTTATSPLKFSRSSTRIRATGSWLAQASWRPFNWLQNDGTVGIDYNNRAGFYICRYLECPASGTLRLGATSSSTTNNRNFSAKITSTATWQANSWANLKTTLGSDYNNVENDGTNSGGTQLPPGAQTVGSAAVISRQQHPVDRDQDVGLLRTRTACGARPSLLHRGDSCGSEQCIRYELSERRYPKFSLSWILSDESFFPKLGWLDQLRLRSAYGASGVQPVPPPHS